MKRILLATLLISLVGLLNVAAQERIFTPELSLPADGAIDQAPDVVLDWNAVTGGNTGFIIYEIQLDTDPAFPSPENFSTELVTAYKSSMLLFGQTYYWRVRAKDGNDISGWSDTWSFRVIRRVILNKPTDASTQKTDVTLTWYAITGINGYEYQIDTTYFWKLANSGQSGNLFDVAAVDDQHAWIVGAGGTVMFFDGTTWTEQDSPISTDLYAVYFLDASNGWAVGKSGKIIRFDGTEWTTQASGVTTDLNGIHMLDANNGWAVGKGGVILRYNGTTWASQFTASKDMQKVFAVDASHVWSVGKVGTIAFYNGTSWVEQVSNTSRDINDVGFLSADHGWAVGKTGLLLEYNSGTWKPLEHSLTNKDLNGIYFTGPDNAWAVGKTGTVLQFDGIEWFSQSGGTATTLNSVALAGSIGFMAGESGTVVSYNDDAFSSPLAVIHPLSGSVLTTNLYDLMFGTQYFWRMRTKHDQATSEWSGARSFVVLDKVELDKPTNNATGIDLDILLEWDAVTDRVNYEIQLDEDASFSSPINLASDINEINAEFLKFGKVYNWRVRAIHAFDVSDWSEPWKFTTVSKVTLDAPANNSTDIKLSPLLSWDALSGIEGYQVHFSASNTFGELLANGVVPVEESTFIVPLVLDKDTDYFWRVRAYNGLDTSSWSDVWTFRTMPPVGIDEPGLKSKVTVYPNPAENTVFIQLRDKSSLSLTVTITDLVGKKVYEQETLLDNGHKTASADVSGLQEGIYMLRIADRESTLTKKLIIKR